MSSDQLRSAAGGSVIVGPKPSEGCPARTYTKSGTYTDSFIDCDPGIPQNLPIWDQLTFIPVPQKPTTK